MEIIEIGKPRISIISIISIHAATQIIEIMEIGKPRISIISIISIHAMTLIIEIIEIIQIGRALSPPSNSHRFELNK